MKRKFITALNSFMALLFLLAAVVQYNDPDMIRWILIYGGAAMSSILWFTDLFKKVVPVIILIVALVWMAFLLPDIVGRETLGARMFDSFKMNDAGVEVAREVGGLLVVAIWMAVLSFTLRGEIKNG